MKKNSKHTAKNARTAKPNMHPASTGGVAQDQETALRKEIKRLKPMIVASRGRGYLETYEIAVIVRRIVDGKPQYGKGAVRKLEAELGTDTKTLYAWADVARAWSAKADFTKVISRKNGKGVPLAWSHLREIAVAATVSRAERDRVVEIALRDSLTVQQLRALIAGKKEDHAPKTAPVTISGGAESFSARVESLVSQHAAWREELRQIPAGSAGQMADVLNSMREACEATIETIEAVMHGPSPAPMPVATVAYATSAAA